MPAMPDVLNSGFTDAVHQSQQVFRCVLEAMSRPGRIIDLPDNDFQPPDGLGKGAAQIALTLLDFETAVWLDADANQAHNYLTFHCGCRVVTETQQAQYLLISDAAAFDHLRDLHIGTDEHPEIAATVIIEVAGLSNEGGTRLRGPGIDGNSHLHIGNAPQTLWQRVADNAALFPRGIDLILTCGNRIAAIPRSTRLEP